MIYENELSAYHGMEVTDIGHGVLLTPFTATGSERTAGYIEIHKTPEGEECAGSVRVMRYGEPVPPGTSWTVEQEEPLTLSPSILCRRCGHHGFIQGGKWVPA